MGGELKATFCLVKDGQALLSQHQGDSSVPPPGRITTTTSLSTASCSIIVRWRSPPNQHPEYLSAKFARDEARARGVLV